MQCVYSCYVGSDTLLKPNVDIDGEIVTGYSFPTWLQSVMRVQVAKVIGVTLMHFPDTEQCLSLSIMHQSGSDVVVNSL